MHATLSITTQIKLHLNFLPKYINSSIVVAIPLYFLVWYNADVDESPTTTAHTPRRTLNKIMQIKYSVRVNLLQYYVIITTTWIGNLWICAINTVIAYQRWRATETFRSCVYTAARCIIAVLSFNMLNKINGSIQFGGCWKKAKQIGHIIKENPFNSVC